MKHLIARKSEIIIDNHYGASITFLSKKYMADPNTIRKYLRQWGIYKPQKFKGAKK